MPGLADRRLSELLDEVAARAPAPGGGSSSALTCALAAALVEMSAAFAGGGALLAGERAGELRARALVLMERELSSYAPVLEARRLPADDPARPERIRTALEQASGAPLEIARAAAEVAAIAVDVAAAAGPSVRADALAGALLAEAAATAAATLVEVNLGSQPDEPGLAAAREARRRAGAARERALTLAAGGEAS